MCLIRMRIGLGTIRTPIWLQSSMAASDSENAVLSSVSSASDSEWEVVVPRFTIDSESNRQYNRFRAVGTVNCMPSTFCRRGQFRCYNAFRITILDVTNPITYTIQSTSITRFQDGGVLTCCWILPTLRNQIYQSPWRHLLTTYASQHTLSYTFFEFSFKTFFVPFPEAPGAISHHFRIPLLPLHTLKFFPTFLPFSCFFHGNSFHLLQGLVSIFFRSKVHVGPYPTLYYSGEKDLADSVAIYGRGRELCRFQKSILKWYLIVSEILLGTSMSLWSVMETRK